MKIGVFDSGLGGLVVLRALTEKLPDYDFVYLGDNARTPYGNRSQEVIYDFARQALDYLFTKEDCGIVIMACNTVSAEALRRLQQEYLPQNFPERRVLGVIRPIVEEVIAGNYKKVGVLATRATIRSGAYVTELKKFNPEILVHQNAAPLLVPLIEDGATHEEVLPFAKKYLQPLLDQGIDVLVLGCTHYPIVTPLFKSLAPNEVTVLDAPVCVANSLADYLNNHLDTMDSLERNSSRRYLITDHTPEFENQASVIFGCKIGFEKVELIG